MNTVSRLILIFILIAGCNKKSKDQRFIEYINDPENKITQVIKIGETQATMKLMTDEYRAFLNKTEIVSDDTGYYYFNATFSKNTGTKPEKEKVMYLNFDMQNDFVLLVKQDSILPSICQKIENGKPGNYEYLLAFKKSHSLSEETFTVFYHDKIFGIGSIAFVYRQEDIDKIPTLLN